MLSSIRKTMGAKKRRRLKSAPEAIVLNRICLFLSHYYFAIVSVQSTRREEAVSALPVKSVSGIGAQE